MFRRSTSACPRTSPPVRASHARRLVPLARVGLGIVVVVLVLRVIGVTDLARAITSAATGLSHPYDRLCVASEGYRELFERKGARAETIVVTGIPNFDNCEKHRKNDFPHRGFVLVCSSDIRETARWEDRPRFIRDVLGIAGGRPVIWKLHPNENAARARAELAALAPQVIVYDGSAEEMIANADVLVTQYSSTAYVGLALGKEVHSFFDGAELRRLCPIQNGGASARNVAAVCRALIEARRSNVAVSSPSSARFATSSGVWWKPGAAEATPADVSR